MANIWNPAEAKYKNDGRNVPQSTLLAVSALSIVDTQAYTTILADQLDTAEIAAAEWDSLTREAVQDEYQRQYMLGRGGRAQMEENDWALVAGLIAAQFILFNGFYRAVKAGELSTPQIKARSGLYVQSSYAGYGNGYDVAAGVAGLRQERWVLDASAENCIDCVRLDARGWVAYGSTGFSPRQGFTICSVGCRCFVEYR